MRPVRGQRDRAVERGIIGIADRRHGGKSIERAAQDHHDQPRVAAIRGAREFRQVRPGGEGGAAEQERAPRRRKRSVAFTAIHRHLLWNSGDIKSIAIACCRDSARSMVRRVSSEAASAAASSSRSRGSRLSASAGRRLRRDVEAQLHAFGRGPCRVGVRKSVRPRRRPQGLAKHIETAEIAAGIIGHAREACARSRPDIRKANASWRAARSRLHPHRPALPQAAADRRPFS